MEGVSYARALYTRHLGRALAWALDGVYVTLAT